MIDETITIQMISALRKKYEAERSAAAAELMIFVRNPVGVGDHPSIMSTVDALVRKVAESEDNLSVVEKYFRLEDTNTNND